MLLTACSKINEGTEIGGDLIPAIDNINTFETFLDVITDNRELNDSTRITFSDDIAIGHIDGDPEFGRTHANAYFNIGRNVGGVYPFGNRDSVEIDSVVLSLAYRGAYGDTNSTQTVRVFEIAQNSGFDEDSSYLFTGEPFAITGNQLGYSTFTVNRLNDSIPLIREGDTAFVANVLRIPLDNSFGQRLASYDTTNTANGAYRTDSILRTLFKGFAIQADETGNALTYFNLGDPENTKLTVYYRTTLKGVIDTGSADFIHHNTDTRGQANFITRTPESNYLAYLTNGTEEDDRLYIQSVPMGSFGRLRIPGLDTFQNSVIHRAELVATRLPSTLDNIFTPPGRLILDKLVPGPSRDTMAFLSDVTFITETQADLDRFGGKLRVDGTYNFNLTRHVQGIITRDEPNAILRLYAPLESYLYSQQRRAYFLAPGTEQVGRGRIVLAGGNYANPTQRLRLRIIWSKI